jgi:hypothetical protein
MNGAVEPTEARKIIHRSTPSISRWMVIVIDLSTRSRTPLRAIPTLQRRCYRMRGLRSLLLVKRHRRIGLEPGRGGVDDDLATSAMDDSISVSLREREENDLRPCSSQNS